MMWRLLRVVSIDSDSGEALLKKRQPTRKWTHYQELSHVQRLRYLWSTIICNYTSAIVVQPALFFRVLYPDYFSCKALIGRPIVKYVFVQ